MASQLVPFHRLSVGEPVPDFTLPSMDGPDISLREYAGNKLIIFMWASW
ncbi:MAG: redoxin domain-containing protein [Chloroflexi bacterium]|nr:redoxin domain-containing protein [Chloroflexota bacterium]